MNSNPSVFDSVDPRVFLLERYRFLRRAGDQVSLKLLASNSGFRSPSAVSMILNGKRRLTYDIAGRLGTAMGLSEIERDFLVAMVRLPSISTPRERTRTLRDMEKARRLSQRKQHQLRATNILSAWYYPCLLILVEMKGFRWDYDWIANRLGKGVTAGQVREAIGNLIQLNLLRIENNKLRRTFESLTTGEETRSLSVRRYHEQMSRLAIRSLALPSDLREFNGLTIAVSPSQLSFVKEQLRQFRKELHLQLSESAYSDNESIYQLNIQFFPIVLAKEERTVNQ